MQWQGFAGSHRQQSPKRKSQRVVDIQESFFSWGEREANSETISHFSKMESSTPPGSSAADDSNAQDPLALPNEAVGLYANEMSRDQNGICGNEPALSISCSDKESNPSNSVNFPNDPSMKLDAEHPLNHEQRLQYDANHPMSSNYDHQKMNQLSMQQNLHEPHKTFSHSIENLSKTTEKCAPNEIKM